MRGPRCRHTECGLVSPVAGALRCLTVSLVQNCHLTPRAAWLCKECYTAWLNTHARRKFPCLGSKSRRAALGLGRSSLLSLSGVVHLRISMRHSRPLLIKSFSSCTGTLQTKMRWILLLPLLTQWCAADVSSGKRSSGNDPQSTCGSCATAGQYEFGLACGDTSYTLQINDVTTSPISEPLPSPSQIRL